MKKRKILTILLITLSLISININLFAHSGRTDSNGGHKDNQNKSGLGSYHYHCGGYPAHLHPNGVCPYASSQSTSSGSSSNSSKNTSSSTSSSSSQSTSSNTSSNASQNTSNNNSKNTSTSTSNSTSSSSSSSSSTGTVNHNSGTSTTVTESTSEENNEIEAKEIQIENPIAELEEGNTYLLTTKVIPNDAVNQNIMWESEDKSIATVTSNGWVTGVKPGIVNLTASTSNGVTKTIAIEIVAKKTENNNEISSNNSQESNVVGGIVGVGILGGAGYLVYKKRKNNNKQP